MSSAIRKVKRSATKKFMKDIKCVSINKKGPNGEPSFFADRWREYELQMKQAYAIMTLKSSDKADLNN